jgi:NAD(P)-dependent dehydrogenase (short-subunit alcohol dehydrogenase family)
MQQAALVTGGAKRIGASIVKALAARGYDIALHYGSSGDEAEGVAETVRNFGRECELFACDLASAEQTTQLVPSVFERFPGCSILVNNASIFERARLMETDFGVFDRQWNVNFRAPFFLSRDFAARCKSGQIINLCDTKVTEELVSHFVYALTKKTLYAFTRMAAKELGPAIRVNAVAPGMILSSKDHTDENLVRMSRKLPLQRKGDADHVVSAVLFLLENDYITGECIFVDGGGHLH